MVKGYTSSSGATPESWGIKDYEKPFKSHGPSTPIKELFKKSQKLQIKKNKKKKGKNGDLKIG